MLSLSLRGTDGAMGVQVRTARKLAGACCAAALVVGMAGTADAGAAGRGGRGHVTELLTGLSSPKGLAVGPLGNLVVAQGAFGPPGPVLAYVLRGRDRGATPITEPYSLVDIAVSPLDGTGWALGPSLDDDGTVHLFHQLADGQIVDVIDLYAYQAGDPDPVDHDDPPNPTESNPYGLTVMANGDALVADAAGNDIIRVTPDGEASTVARLDLQTVSTDHLPGFPAPTLEAEAVPTTVTIGPDGAIYVGELKGFPFRPGSSNIWRIEPDADGAWCSVDAPDPTGDCTLYSSGYTAIQDIAFDDRTGNNLYVYELAAAGVLAFEEGLETGDTPPAVLLQVSRRRGEQRVELAAGQLSQPGGVVVARGQVYVTDGIFSDGRLLRIDG